MVSSTNARGSVNANIGCETATRSCAMQGILLLGKHCSCHKFQKADVEFVACAEYIWQSYSRKHHHYKTIKRYLWDATIMQFGRQVNSS